MAITVTGQDFAYGTVNDETLDEAIVRVMDQFGVVVEVQRDQGPSGWPEVSIEGDVPSVTRALADGWGMNDEDILEILRTV